MSRTLMNSKLYGFTIKETFTKQDLLTEATYSLVLNKLKAKGEIIDIVFENKRKNGTPARLHCHGVIDFKVIPKLTSLCPPTFSMRFEKIWDLPGWNRYCSKNLEYIEILKGDIEDMYKDNFDRTKYMFDD